MPEIKPELETFAKIKVVGVGGGGGAAINRMVSSKIKGVEFIAINTDIQDLHHNNAKLKLHIGQTTTKGLGAGMNPELGFQAAQESINDIRDALKGADMVFITCGLGGGTGSGVSPSVAAVAKEMGALVVAIVTKPFAFEGAQRRNIAEKAHQELSDRVDTIITIPNDKILQIIDKKTSLLNAFGVVDDVLRQAIQGISELITVPGLINVDFADVKAIMQDAGSALMGIGETSGEGRAASAAKKAISSPLLDLSIDGAKGILFTIAGSSNMTMDEVNEAANIITESADSNAKIIFGTIIDEGLKDKIRITVVASGFGDRESIKKISFEEPKYSMNRFFSKKNIEEKPGAVKTAAPPEKPAFISTGVGEEAEKPRLKVASSRPSVPKPSPEDEDLDIPAFIRKKMK